MCFIQYRDSEHDSHSSAVWSDHSNPVDEMMITIESRVGMNAWMPFWRRKGICIILHGTLVRTAATRIAQKIRRLAQGFASPFNLAMQSSR